MVILKRRCVIIRGAIKKISGEGGSARIYDRPARGGRRVWQKRITQVKIDGQYPMVYPALQTVRQHCVQLKDGLRTI